jgi:hypothetical protein
MNFLFEKSCHGIDYEAGVRKISEGNDELGDSESILEG